MNLYGYGANNPTNTVDREGLCPGDWWDLFEQFVYGAEEGAYASIDSAIPFADPFSSRYDRNHSGVEFSYQVGGPALQTVLTAGAARAAGYVDLFGRGGTGLLNSNNYLRIGYGWNAKKGQEVFRIAVGNKKAPIHWHRDLWEK